MDSDNFFGFDASIPHDEDGELDDDEYDALNDETFGSAAVGGDWEENHKQLSSLTEAERLQVAIGKDVNAFTHRHNNTSRQDYQLQELHNNEDLHHTLDNLSINKIRDKKRLYERSVDSSPLIGLHDEISFSQGSSIWSPTLGLDSLKNLSLLNKTVNNSSRPIHTQNNQSVFNEAQHFRQNNVQSLHDLNLGLRIPSTVKTVSELEDELKRQHSNNLQMTSKTNITLNDLEKELSRQLNSRKRNNLQSPNSFLGMRGAPNANFQAPLQQQHSFFNNSENYSNNHLQHNFGNAKPMGNIQHPLHYPHPLLNNLSNMPPGFVNNAPNIFNRHPFNQQMNHRGGHPIRGIFQGGNHPGRNNMNRLGFDQNNFDQNMRYDQMRNNHDLQREKNNCQAGGRIRRDSDAEWEEWQKVRQADEYAGLMTPREKGWLRNIQAMQLETENPYQDDYYYVMNNVKQQRKREEEVIELDGLQLLLPDRGKEGKEYEPPRLENSLGKLQVASVNAPRKIIDLQVVHLDSSHPATTLQKDMRKHRHLLLHIEQLYNIQIELDDLERKIRALPDCPTRDLFRSKCKQLVSKLWAAVTNPHESFVQLLCIRKGKTLAARLLSWVGQSEIEHTLATIIQNLSLLTKKDINDKRLPLFWPFADRFFNSSSLSTIISFGIMMEPQLKDQKKQYVPALSSKLGLSLVLSLLVRGGEFSKNLANDESWQQFLKNVAISLSGFEEKKYLNIQPLPSVTLAASYHLPSHHLSKCIDVEPAIMHKAIEVLKIFESYLSQNLSSTNSTSSSISSFMGERRTQATSVLSTNFNLQVMRSNSDSTTPNSAVEIF